MSATLFTHSMPSFPALRQTTARYISSPPFGLKGFRRKIVRKAPERVVPEAQQAASKTPTDADLLDNAVTVTPHEKALEGRAETKHPTLQAGASRGMKMPSPPLMNRPMSSPRLMPKSGMVISDIPLNLQKCLRLSIVGLPNSGKSCLANALLQDRLSAVSQKVNTTRQSLRGIYTRDAAQLIFYDTPGIIPFEEAGLVSVATIQDAWKSLEDIDTLLVNVDASIARMSPLLKHLLSELGADEFKHIKKLLVLNKIDKVPKRQDLFEMAERVNSMLPCEETFFVSALLNRQVNELRQFLLDEAPVSPWLYDAGVTSDLSVDQRICELIRENIFKFMNKELPYHVRQEHQGLFHEKSHLRIEHRLYVENTRHRDIITGPGGKTLKRIILASVPQLQALFGRRIDLRITVKLLKNSSRRKLMNPGEYWS